MGTHDLTRKAEPNARTFLLGGEEWNEDLFLTLWRDWHSIVPHMNESLIILIDFGSDEDMLRSCLHCILDQIDENAEDLRLVGIDQYIVGLWTLGADRSCLIALLES